MTLTINYFRNLCHPLANGASQELDHSALSVPRPKTRQLNPSVRILPQIQPEMCFFFLRWEVTAKISFVLKHWVSALLCFGGRPDSMETSLFFLFGISPYVSNFFMYGIHFCFLLLRCFKALEGFQLLWPKVELPTKEELFSTGKKWNQHEPRR